MNKTQIRIGIIGAGSIGSLFGGYIASVQSSQYSPEVVFYCRKAHAAEINKKKLSIIKINGERITVKIRAFENLEDHKKSILEGSFQGFDFLFLCTKTYDIESAMMQYKKIIEKSRRIVILQNGLGNEDFIEKYCSREKLFRIVTSNGALLDGPGKVIHTGIGFTKLGFPYKKDFKKESEKLSKINEDLNLLKEWLDLGGLETTLSDDIIKDCWEKIFVNIGINALGALTRLRNGQLLENERLKHLMGEAVNEAINVAKMKKIHLSDENFIELTYDVAYKCSENKNSMLQDVLKGKNTEIDFINGRIVNYAEELGIKVPLNEILTSLIKGLERSFD